MFELVESYTPSANIKVIGVGGGGGNGVAQKIDSVGLRWPGYEPYAVFTIFCHATLICGVSTP